MAIKDQERRDLIAGELRAHRAKANLSQAQVAKAVDMEKSAIGRYEQGAVELGIETAWDMANLYGVSLDEMVGREHAPTKARA